MDSDWEDSKRNFSIGNCLNSSHSSKNYTTKIGYYENTIVDLKAKIVEQATLQKVLKADPRPANTVSLYLGKPLVYILTKYETMITLVYSKGVVEDGKDRDIGEH
jgi:hypothetical protein